MKGEYVVYALAAFGFVAGLSTGGLIDGLLGALIWWVIDFRATGFKDVSLSLAASVPRWYDQVRAIACDRAQPQEAS